MKNQLAFCAILLAFLTMGIWQYRDYQEKKILKEQLKEYHSTYLTKGGFISISDEEYLYYTLRSFDGGKQWYVITKSKGESVIIKGNVETVYPGLQEYLIACEHLTSAIRDKKPTPVIEQLVEHFSKARKVAQIKNKGKGEKTKSDPDQKS